MIGFGFEIPKLAVFKSSIAVFEIICNYKTQEEECVFTVDSKIFNVQEE